MTWLILLVLQAQDFCKDIHLPKVACMDAYVECLLDDSKNFCESEFMYYYEGRENE